jgi:PAS domain S-box-containing protein
VGTRLEPDVQQAADELLGIRETQLRQALSLANSGSWEWDVASDVVTWSPELRRIIGVGPEVVASSRVFNSFIHPEDHDWIMHCMGEAIRTGISDDVHFRFVRPDGSVRRFRGHGLAIRFEGGKAAYMVGVIQDLGCADERSPVALEREALRRISGREREVLLRVVEGATSKEIATTLGLSPKTVETYRSRIMTKLKVNDLAGLIRFSIRHGLTVL